MTSSNLDLALQATGDTLAWPDPPSFDDPERERRHRKERLALAFRVFAHYGFDWGIGGHITCRDPIVTDHFWVNPVAVHFGRMRVSDLVRVDADGHVVEGHRPTNAAAYAIHSRIHRARPDIIAACHAHSRFGVTFSTLGERLKPISQETCTFYDDHGLYEDYGGVAAIVSEGDGIARALGNGKAVICRNHGPITVGTSVDEAAWWFIRFERACEQTLLARAAGIPHEIHPDTARLAARQLGSHKAGWFSIQPIMEKMLSEAPDVLE